MLVSATQDIRVQMEVNAQLVPLENTKGYQEALPAPTVRLAHMDPERQQQTRRHVYLALKIQSRLLAVAV